MRRVFYIPVQALLLVARVMRHTPLFPSFWRAVIGSTQIGYASRAYTRGSLEESFNTYKALADHDTTDASLHEKAVISTAAYIVGYMYAHGEGVQQNHEMAEEYLRKAAYLEHPDAINYFADRDGSE